MRRMEGPCTIRTEYSESTPSRMFLEFEHQHDSKQFEYSPNLTIDYVLAGLKSVRAIEYDAVAKQVYWIDGKAVTIRHSSENGSHNVAIVGGNRNSNDEYAHLFDMALEPISKVLFWSCSATDTINVTRLTNASLGCVFKGV